MSKYKVVKYFTDLQDNSYAYHAGDLFPRDGMTVTDKRLEELSSSKNKRGIPLIEKIAEEKPAPKEEVKIETEPEVKEEAVPDEPKKPANKSGKKEKVNSDAE